MIAWEKGIETTPRPEDARDYRVAWEHVSSELRKKEKELSSVKDSLNMALMLLRKRGVVK